MKSQAIQLKIILTGTNPIIWRRIHILANSSLRTLQYTIADVMEWKYMHLYIFLIGEDEYGDPDLDSEFEGWLDDSKMTVGRIVKNYQEFKFVYDFEDNWTHQVIFEDILDADINEQYPVCVSGENASPPEDCGGVHGFEEFKKSVPVVKWRQPENFWESMATSKDDSGFDPHFFDLIKINSMNMKRRRKINSVKKK
jgi:hypothetical protein